MALPLSAWWPGFTAESLEEAFQYEVLKMRKKEGKINDAIIENMLSWRHTGFHVYVGSRPLSQDCCPNDQNGLEKFATIIRACFYQERMVYIPVEESADGVAKVLYTSKDGKTQKIFDALDWLAQLVVRVPDRYEQLILACQDALKSHLKRADMDFSGFIRDVCTDRKFYAGKRESLRAD